MTTAATTGYDVSLRYVLEDRTGPGLKVMNRELADANRGARELHGSLGALSSLGGMATGLAGMFGLHEAKKALIDFNAEMEVSRLTVAGMLQMNVGGEWADNFGRATEMVQKLQQESLTSTATTKEMYEMLTMIVQPISKVGASMEQMTKLTGSMTVLSKAMWFAPQIAAIEMTEAMNGTLNARNRFMNAILGTKDMGYGGEAGRRKWNTLSDQKRFQEINRALNSGAVQQMKSEQAHTFQGEVSTLEDRLQIAMGKVGLPLFKEVTAEIRSWNSWLASNEAKLQDFGKSVGRDLVFAFQELRKVGEFLVANKGWMLEAAKLWGGLKIAGVFGSTVGGIGGLFGGVRGSMKDLDDALIGKKAGVVPALGGMATGLASATANVVALGAAAYNLGTWLGDWISAHDQEKAHGLALTNFTGPQTVKDIQELRQSKYAAYDLERFSPGLAGTMHATQKAAFERFRKGGLLSGDHVDTDAVATMLDQDKSLKRDMANALGLTRWSGKTGKQEAEYNPHVIAEAMAKMLDQSFKKIMEESTKKPPDITPAAPSSEKPKVNVTIQRIEVVSDDPDRFITNLAQAARDAVKNPSQARRVLREGG